MNCLIEQNALFQSPKYNQSKTTASYFKLSIMQPCLRALIANRCINTPTCKQTHKSYMTAQMLQRTLTLLPSLCQNTAGCGFPLASHGKVAARPCITIWSRGLTTNWGASEVKGQMGIIANTQTQVARFSLKGMRDHRCGHVLCKSRGVGKRCAPN